MTVHDDPFHRLRNTPAIAEALNRNANGEVEQALLGVLLTQPGAFGKTVGRVTADDFADPVHAMIFDAIAERVGKGRAVDHLLLGDVAEACDAELAPLGGGRAYLAGLAASAGFASVGDYADTVHEYAQRRRLIDAGLRAVVAGSDADRVDAAVSTALADVEALVESGAGRSRSQVLADLVASMERPARVYPTGFRSLDRAMGGGLHAGRMYCFAGLGKRGKSTLAGGVSHALNRQGVRHGYLALEMGSAEIEQRQIARDIGVNSLSLLGHVHPSVLARVGAYAVKAMDYVWYVDMPGGSADRLRTEVMAARYRHRCTGVIVDYWQLVSGRPGGVSEEEHLRRVAEWLASAAKRLGIWILVLAQLADDGEATAVCRTGMNRNADQLYFIRGDADSEWRWLQMVASRYTPLGDVGSPDDPSLRLVQPGPHFEDWASRGAALDPAA